MFYSVALWSLASFSLFYSMCVYSMSGVFRCHSSLGVSTVIMSSFGNTLCGLPVHVGSCLCLLTCAYLRTLYTCGYSCRAPHRMCVRVCVLRVRAYLKMCVRQRDCECVNMSGCRRRPISWCISEEVSMHTPVCGPITPAHHTLTYRHTDSIALLIIETQ